MKLLLSLTVLLLIELFGWYDPSQMFLIPGAFKAYDLALILSLLWFACTFSRDTETSIAIIKSPTSFLIYIFYALVLVESIQTFMGGGASIKSVLQVARNYLPYMLLFPIMYDVIKTDSMNYYVSFMLVIAVAATIILFLVGVFDVEWFDSWPNLHAGEQEEYIQGVKRAYFTAFLFPVVGMMLILWRIIIEKNNSNLPFLLLLITGFVLQGFRSYIIAALISLFTVYAFYIRLKVGKIFSFAAIIGAFLFAFFILGNMFGLNTSLIQDRILSAYYDLINLDGTFAYRLFDDAFRWDVYLEGNKLLGVGMLHHESERALSMGVQQYGMFSLTTSDSGYLDILLRFGIPGALFFSFFTVFLFNRYIKAARVLPQHQKAVALATASFILTIFITQITHAGFTFIYGIVPLVICLSLVEAALVLHNSKSKA